MAKFHAKPFDESTLLKLEIFRGYIREWLPVFLTKTDFWQVHVFDFFAGPGSDVKGSPGSPLVILEELDTFMRERSHLVGETASVTLHFNDENPDHIEQLKTVVASRASPGFCKVQFSEQDFSEALAAEMATLRQLNTANLVLLDQFGMKHVTPDVFRKLVDCPTTDVLFFISSSTVRRFCDEKCIQQYLPVDPEEICRVSNREVHRYICRRYKAALPPGREYYLAPFSIQKTNKANIYGVIFGSEKLLGLEKFPRVCWGRDQLTGEANYNIDDDFVRDGRALWPEWNVVKKQDRFRNDLEGLLKASSCTNREIYRFTLESGFLPKQVNDILRILQRDGMIEVIDVATGTPARKGAFYISWGAYSTGKARVAIRYKR